MPKWRTFIGGTTEVTTVEDADKFALVDTSGAVSGHMLGSTLTSAFQPDTGWRNLSAVGLLNGWTTTGLYIKRAGKIVFLSTLGGRLDGSAATAARFYDLPTGFAPWRFVAGTNTLGIGVGTSGGSFTIYCTKSGGVGTADRLACAGFGSANHVYSFHLDWSVHSQVFPTSLPGTAA